MRWEDGLTMESGKLSIYMDTTIEHHILMNIARWHVEKELEEIGFKGYMTDIGYYSDHITVGFKVTGKVKSDG